MAKVPTTKVWKASRGSTAGIVVSEVGVSIVGDSRNVVHVGPLGITLMGGISFATTANNIRRGGLFTGVNDFTDMIPSTIITPIPKQIPFPPVAGVLNIHRDLAYFTAQLAPVPEVG